MAELVAEGHGGAVDEVEPGLDGITVSPGVGIGQRALLVRTPGKVPLSAAVVRRIADRVLALDLDRLYDNFSGQVPTDAHSWVGRSAERYIGRVRGDFDHLTEP